MSSIITIWDTKIIKTIWDAKIILSLILDHFSKHSEEQKIIIVYQCLKEFSSRTGLLFNKDISFSPCSKSEKAGGFSEVAEGKNVLSELEKTLDNILDNVSEEGNEETLKTNYKSLKEIMRHYVT